MINRRLEAEGGNYHLGTAADVELTITRAPFSEPGTAERLRTNPKYYRRLALFAAEELKQQIAQCEAQLDQGNSSEIIKGELIRLQTGFETVAAEIQSEEIGYFDRAAKAIAELREGLAKLCENHAELVDGLLKLAVVCTASYVLHQFGGATGDTAAFISYAVIRREKLTDILKAAFHGK